MPNDNFIQRKYQRHMPEPTLEVLFTVSFMNEYSKTSSIVDLFEQGGFHVRSLSDINKIDKDVLDPFIKKQTSFFSWDDMLDAAQQSYMAYIHNTD